MRATNHYSLGSSQGDGRPEHLSLRLLREVGAGLRWRGGLFVVMVAGFGLTALLPTLLLRYFTFNVVDVSQVNVPVFVERLLWFGTAVAFALMLSHLGQFLCQEWLRLQLEADLRRRMLLRFHELPLTALDTAPRGEWIKRITGDLAQAERFLGNSLPNQIRDAAILLAAGALFIRSSGLLALVPLVTAILVALVSLLVQRKVAPLLAELRALHGGVFQLLLESLEGIRTVRSHSGEPYVQRLLETRLAEISAKGMQTARYLGAWVGGTELVSRLAVTGCLSAVAYAYVGSHGPLSLIQVLTYPFFIGVFYDAALGLAGSANDWNLYLTQGGRFAQLLFSEGESSRSRPSLLSEYDLRRGSFTEAARLQLRELSIGYAGKAVGPPMAFRVDRHQICALVGPSGVGKSTFLEVVAGLRPALSGEATILNARGEAIWGSQVTAGMKLPIGPCAYVEQVPYIFEGTLRENLTFGNPSRLSDMVLWETLERTNLYPLVIQRGGLDLALRGQDANLSVGEQYRIALCRAMLLRRPFLLVDEPFASLDDLSTVSVIQALMAEADRSGIVLVTHYLPEGLEVDTVMNFRSQPQELSMDRGMKRVALGFAAGKRRELGSPFESDLS